MAVPDDVDELREHLRTEHRVYDGEEKLPADVFMVFREFPGRPGMVFSFHEWLHETLEDKSEHTHE